MKELSSNARFFHFVFYCDHRGLQYATTRDHALFVSVLWSHIGDHASAATNH